VTAESDLEEACRAGLRSVAQASTLTELFSLRAKLSADRPFLHFRDRVHTWADVLSETRRWASHLRSLGCASGDRIVVLLPNCDAQVVLLLACAEAGLVFTPLNTALTQPETEAVLRVAEPSLAIVVATQAAKLAAAAAALDRAVPTIEIGTDLVLPSAGTAWSSGLAPGVDADNPLAIMFTSGTTGTPKGALHVNRSYVLAAQVAAYRMRLTAADRLLVVLPLFHLNALFYSVGGAIVSGASLVIEESFSASGFWAVVDRFGITQVNIIAAVGNILLKRDRAEFPGNATLRKVSAAPVTREVADALHAAFGIEHVVESYGMTEAPGIAQVDFHDRDHRACLGRPISHPLTGEPLSEIRLVDGGLSDVPTGEVGRVMVRAKTMMKGYFNRPDAPGPFLAGGWFLTEDLARSDADGFFYFFGRTSEIIRSRGENVAASEIEAVLLTHPGVGDAGCIGVPSELGEQDILAAVSPRPGAVLAPEELARFCTEHLSRHKRPRYLTVLDALPKTPTEKVARHRIAELPGLVAEALDVTRSGAR